jgi:hypothetical protein
MASGSRNLRVDDDGLMTPDVGGWAETKYRLLALYDELFSTGMKNKWDQRVYVDLYAGSGYSRIQGTSRFLKANLSRAAGPYGRGTWRASAAKLAHFGPSAN